MTTKRLTSDEAMMRVAAYDAGKRHFHDYGYRADGPLSGAWAGESIPELSQQYGFDLWEVDLADAFEEGYADAEMATLRERTS